ncbi:MAG: carboxypeptidase regulatory-like domain-containing protein [Bryobacterales bacterium]|nr:carboxypeptidase regulatory-like domain-containing protein [Bryobacterales bacterium]
MFEYLSRRFVRLFALFLLCLGAVNAQTYRGEIRGTVKDGSGAVLEGAVVTAENNGTGVRRSTPSNGSGEFTFPDMPLGQYVLTVSMPGFQQQRSQPLEVVVSRVTSIDFALGLAQVSETVEVAAEAALLEVQSTALTGVVSTKTVSDIPINGRDFRQMIKLSPGVGTGNAPSINGSRSRGNNWQIDGADNVDAFQGYAAVNQGGVSGIPGVVLPMEAVDQFSLQSNGGAEVGRNGGGQVNVAIKSGTNDIHGSAFYYNRNEALAENSPFAPAGSQVRRVRNHQGGFSLGGPVVLPKFYDGHNRTFFFMTGEFQIADAANSQPVTTLSPAWLARGQEILSQFGQTVNPVSANLVSFWPERVRSGPAVANNYTSLDSNDYDSFNGIVKMDHSFNSNNQLSVRWYSGTGKQAALVNTAAPFEEYFQVAPSRMHNTSVALNSVITPRLVNSLTLGVNYFLQTFNDQNTSFDPIAAGLNTAATSPDLIGSPTITINGFASAGATQPLGRIDTTGHITNTASFITGKHQLKFGGEYRRGHMDIFYKTNQRGTFRFDGTSGPWANTTSIPLAERALADFLGGYVSGNNGATIVRGNTQRDYRQNSMDLFVHDNWQATERLNLNFGLRYTYLGPIFDIDKSITTFVPDRGIVVDGTGTGSLYPKDWNNIAPRFGFAFTPSRNSKWVLRGGYGFFFDTPAGAFFAANSGGGNGGAAGVNANPGGPDPVFSLTRNSFQLTPGEDIFGGSTPVPPFGVLGVSQGYRTPYVQNFNLNIQRQVWSGGVLQAGYVGSVGRKLTITRNINAPVPGTTGTAQQRRPYNAAFPTLATINQLESVGNSNYNSMQLSFRQRAMKGLTFETAYTWSKSLDIASDARNANPANPYNLRAEYGPSSFDLRHSFVGFASYSLPSVAKVPRWLGSGWQFNSLFTAHSGAPLDLRAGTNRSGILNNFDRVDVVGDAFANVATTGTNRQVRWFDAAAFAVPALGTFGNIGRNAIYGPGFFSMDPSIFKETKIGEHLTLQLRGEIYNITNYKNYANPGVTISNSTTFGLITNTRNGSSAPGLGFGEPRNAQLAIRLMW